MTAIQLIGNGIFFTIGLIVGASIMYYNACPTCGSTDLEEITDEEEDEE